MDAYLSTIKLLWQVEGVVTDEGVIKTSCVVNCTGAWANQICSHVGLQVPLGENSSVFLCENSNNYLMDNCI